MKIPQELVDKVIDRVWDADDSPSHPTTKAVSLVSRSWVDRSQHHLFHNIQFSFSGPSFSGWCDAVSPGPDGVSRHTRSLTIQASGRDGWWIGKQTFERGLPFFNSFRNVQVLRVSYWDVGPFPLESLTRCFTSFAGSVRVLQWDPHIQISRESWTRIIGLFPLADCLLLYPKYFPTGLLSNTHAGPTRKKLVLFGERAAQCLAWSGGRLRFREVYIRCGMVTTAQTIISIANGDVEQLEILSIAGISKGQTFSVLRVLILNHPSIPAINLDPRMLPSLLSRCHALRELSIDWFPAESAPELRLVDAIPGGCIQSLRVMPNRDIWLSMWDDDFENAESSMLMPPYEALAQAILQLGMRNSRKKISVWIVVPRVPYAICDPILECVIALWEKIEGVVSFGFLMTEAEDQNIDKRHLITNLA